MPADRQGGADRRRVPLTRVLRAVRELGDVNGSSPKQILGRLNDDAAPGKEIDKVRLALALKKGVAAGALAARRGRYRVANADDDRELGCCPRRRRRRSVRRRRRSCRRRRRSCRRRRRSCRRRRRSCRRRRRSCRRRRRSCRRRRRSCRRRRRSCRRRRPVCPRRRRRSCRRRRRRCSGDDDLSEAASLASRAGDGSQSREPSRGHTAGGVGVPVGVGGGAGNTPAGQ